MCTVSWLHTSEGYQLLCNRDEKRTRRPAEAPRLFQDGDTRYLAPVDGDYGGTWISSNEFGISICLLNGSPGNGRASADENVSRGRLVTAVAKARTAWEAAEQVTAMDLRKFAPFQLVAIGTERPVMTVAWDGHIAVTHVDSEKRLPLVSSSVDPDGVLEFRRERFRKLIGSTDRVDGSVLFEFHQSHTGLYPDAYSPCMHREDAETVSFSWVKVSPSAVEFFYSPSAPCRWSPGVTTTLERRSP